MNTTSTTQHKICKTIAYHLLPGIVILVCYLVITPYLHKAGLPSVMSLWLISLMVLVPLELGILYWQGKNRNGRFSLEGILLNREKTPILTLILWAIIVLGAAVLCFALFKNLDGFIQKYFSWLSSWLFFNNEDLSTYCKTIQFINWLGVFLVTGFVAPLVEELYFRGFLLPRMNWMKKWAPLVEALLFALYHFWSPWQFITRFLAVLPLDYIVNWKKNLRVGVAAYWFLNAVGSLELLFAVLI